MNQSTIKCDTLNLNLLLFTAKSKPDTTLPTSSLANLASRDLSPLDQLVGQTQVWTDIKNIVYKASCYPSNVLIEGESGTGKELVAQTIHTMSKRPGAFVAINCGAIPKGLIESELFGYDEGSFTGAKRGGFAGKFEMADQGTIFLDEIGEMPAAMQVTLLRFLQDKTITRVGSNKIRKLDVRIIAASNRDLNSEIEKGNFRKDLFFRLNVINIIMPPLRERTGDIGHLVHYFLKLLCCELDREIPQISNEAMRILTSYHWPGNVRELSNIIERAVIFNEGNIIVPDDLPTYIRTNSDPI